MAHHSVIITNLNNKQESFGVGPTGAFFKTLEYESGGIILTSEAGSEIFIPYHRVWEIQTRLD